MLALTYLSLLFVFVSPFVMIISMTCAYEVTCGSYLVNRPCLKS